MIGVIVGTSEGKNIVSMLNEFTEDIFISTATNYGGELLKDYKYKILNTTPLDLGGIINAINKNNINVLIDSSHPYALEITRNAMKACEICNIEYIRYERASVVSKFETYDKLIQVDNYDDIYDYLKDIGGNVLNTTGSRNIKKILDFNLPNRIIHRVLPSLKVLDECLSLGIKVEDIIAIKGPISYQLNSSFIREYDAKAILMKDSGVEGGTQEKIKAAIGCGIYVFIIKRTSIQYNTVFYEQGKLVKYIEDKNL